MQYGPRSTIRHHCVLRASHEGLVGLQHWLQFLEGVNAVLKVGFAFVLLSLSGQTTKRSRCQPKLLFFLSPIGSHVGRWDTLHPEYLNLVTAAARERILNPESVTSAGKSRYWVLLTVRDRACGLVGCELRGHLQC